MDDLKKQMNRKIVEFCLSGEQKSLLLMLLEIIKNHDEDTYSHCTRVGLKGVETAEFLGLDPKPLFYAGLFHDFGKLSVERRILQKLAGLSCKDFKKIKKHPILGYIFLKRIYPFSADILVRHHSYTSKPYPKRVPKTIYDKKLIRRYAQLLVLIDFHDALFFRKNEKFQIDISDKNQVRALTIKHHKKIPASLINILFDKDIL